MTEPTRVKLTFKFTADEDGWPPIRSECVWAVRVDRDHVQVDNVPVFADHVALGDVFRVRQAGTTLLKPERVASSDNNTIRVFVLEDGPLKGDLRRALDLFAPLGVKGESMSAYGIVALNVPPTADLQAVWQVLLDGEADGSWGFEEACITRAWEYAGRSIGVTGHTDS